MLRGGYTAYMRLWNNSDELTLVGWFPAEKDALPFGAKTKWDAPVRHHFDTLNDRRGPELCDGPDPYRPDEGCNNTDIGEQGTGFSTDLLPRVYDGKGNLHGLTGRSSCRPDLAFTGGTVGVDPPLDLDDDGVPLCCPRADQWQGGESEGGRWLDKAGEKEVWQGGESEGGRFLDTAPYADLWSGGEAEGGRWLDVGGPPELWYGGEAEGGLWEEYSIVLPIPTPVTGLSGVEGPGSVTFTFTLPAGTVAADVWASTTGVPPWTLIAVGVASPATISGLPGGVSLAFVVAPQGNPGGEGVWAGPLYLTPGFPTDLWSGGESNGGLWVDTAPYADLWSGGEAEGGRWEDTGGPPQLWYGGEAEGGQFHDTAGEADRWQGGEAEGGGFADFAGEADHWQGGEAEGGGFADFAGAADSWSGGEAEGGHTLDTAGEADRWQGGEAEGGAVIDALPLPPYPSAVLATSGLVAYWKLDEPSGSVMLDSGPSSDNGGYVGGPILGQSPEGAGVGGTAVLFGGLAQYAEAPLIGPFAGLGSFTLMCWAKLTVAPRSGAYSGICGRAFSSNATPFYQWQLFAENSFSGFSLFLTVNGTLQIVESNSAATAGAWYHLAGTYDVGIGKAALYINGVQVVLSSLPGVLNEYGQPFNIGVVHQGSTLRNYFPGTIDEVSVFNRALTATEIANLYALR